MKIHRFIVDNDVTKKIIFINDLQIIDQIRKVLRLGVGDKLKLSDGKGIEATVEIEQFRSGVIKTRRLEITGNVKNEVRGVCLYCAVLKKSNFELVVQKATEIGVVRIVPLITKRTVKLNLKIDRLERIAREAAEQSGRNVVPEIDRIIEFASAVEEIKNIENFLFDEKGKQMKRFPFPVDRQATNEKRINLWIGPEGGWDPGEIKLAQKQDFNIVSLGKTTLRAETAAIIASYLAVQFQDS